MMCGRCGTELEIGQACSSCEERRKFEHQHPMDILNYPIEQAFDPDQSTRS